MKRAGARFRQGDLVIHHTFGPGKVLKRWGTWAYCKECNHDLAGPDHAECPGCGIYAKVRHIQSFVLDRWLWTCLECGAETGEPRHALCPECARITLCLQINGGSILEVQFGLEIIPINQCWLRKASPPGQNKPKPKKES